MNRNTQQHYAAGAAWSRASLDAIRSLPCLSGRIFSREIIATALIKYVCIFSCSTGGEDRRMLIREREREEGGERWTDIKTVREREEC